MNAVLLPIVLGYLVVLEASVLPKHFRMQGLHRIAAWSLSAVVMAFGLFMAIRTLLALS